MALWWPLDNVRVTGEWANSPAFYAQFGQQGHNGIDLGCAVGTPVYAADDGIIHFEGWGQNNSWMGKIAGICVIVRHTWGYTGYAHLSNTVINNGQAVARGQLIGHSGATGVGTGPHLHFETLPPNPNFGNGFAGRVNPHTFGLVPRGSSNKPAPAALAAHQRQVGSEPVNRRVTPDRSRPPIDPQLAANEVGDFNGWIRGESVNGNNVWFRGAHSGNWFWSGGFTSQSTDGLADLNPKQVEDPKPVKPVEPVKPVSGGVPDWDASAPAENPVFAKPVGSTDFKISSAIRERSESVSKNGYTEGRPDKPKHIVIHHAWTDSLSSAVNTLRGTIGAPTANYVVKDLDLVSMVPEVDSPWTNGRWTSNLVSVTFELINESARGDGTFTAPSRLTIETTAEAVARSALRWGMDLPLQYGVNVFGHRDVSKSATSCPGETDVAGIIARANELITKHLSPGSSVEEEQAPERNEEQMSELTPAQVEQVLAAQQQVMGQIKPVDLGNIITNNSVRKLVWAIYGITGLFLVAGIGGLTATQTIGEQWFIFTVGAYAALGPAFSSLAIANISTTKK